MGRRPSGRLPAQPLTYLWEYHREIARRLVAGDRQCDIARDLGLTESRLSIIVNSPEHQRLVHELSTEADHGATDIAGRLRSLSSNAVDVLELVIKRETAPLMVALQVKVAEMILDRAGHGPTKNINQGGRVEHTVAAEGVLGSALEALRRRASGGASEDIRLSASSFIEGDVVDRGPS